MNLILEVCSFTSQDFNQAKDILTKLKFLDAEYLQGYSFSFLNQAPL